MVVVEALAEFLSMIVGKISVWFLVAILAGCGLFLLFRVAKAKERGEKKKG
jgi:Ca2+/Na+ antiporter|tara:strand:+ start:24560 stop:24712 length:153 start_codon:yes stop_codon:yes gene_type:complete